jgi:hypothetical protein
MSVSFYFTRARSIIRLFSPFVYFVVSGYCFCWLLNSIALFILFVRALSWSHSVSLQLLFTTYYKWLSVPLFFLTRSLIDYDFFSTIFSFCLHKMKR